MEWQDLIAPIAALIAAVIGGKMTADSSRKSVSQTLKGQERRDKERQQQLILGVLEAIHEELNEFWKDHTKGVGEYWDEKFEKKGYFSAHIEISSNYCIMYNSNANYIGQIPNSELRREIVKVYMLLGELISGYKLNTRALIDLEKAGDAGNTKAYDEIKNALRKNGRKLREEYYALSTSIKNLLKMLKKECNIADSTDNSS